MTFSSLISSLLFMWNIINPCLMYGQVLQQKQAAAHMVAPPHEATFSHSDDPTEVVHVPRTISMH